MTSIAKVAQNWIPDTRIARRLCMQTVVYSLALGIILPGSAAYFTRHVHLSLREFGLAFSLATCAAVLAAIPLGALADHYGAKQVWALAALLESVAFLGYLISHQLASAAVAMSLAQVGAVVGNSARMAYTLDVVADQARVRTLAQTRVWFNIGAAAGGAAATVALAIPGGLAAIPAVAAALAGANAWAVSRLPTNTARARHKPNPFTSAALRDRPFVATALVMGVLGSSEAVMGVVLPAWMLGHTALPPSAMGLLFVLNTVLVVVLQVPFTKGSEGIAGAGTAGRRAGLLMSVMCLAAMGLTVSRVPAAVLAVALLVFVLLTLSELLYSASRWSTFAEIAPSAARAHYQSVYQLGARAAVFLTPVTLTAALGAWGAWGWLSWAGLNAAAAVALPMCLRSYERQSHVGRTREHR